MPKGYPKSAEQQVLESIDELLCGQDDALVLPMNSLNQGVAKVFENHAKIITKMQDRLLRAADKEAVRNIDKIDGVFTRLLQGLDGWQFDAHFLLTQLAAKGGMAKVGDPLEAALIKEITEAPQLAYAGTLVLAVKEAVPYLDQLIEVLREIRDRMPPKAIHVRGEVPALAPTDEPDAETQEALPEIDEPSIEWEEV